jgi:hypothetical protein
LLDGLKPPPRTSGRRALLRKPPVGFGETPVFFGDVGVDPTCGAIELVAEKPVTAGRVFRVSADPIGEIDRALLHRELLNGKAHATQMSARTRERVESRE